jgi:hypothetical protein
MARPFDDGLSDVRSPESRERGQRSYARIHLQAIVGDLIIAREQSVQTGGNENASTLRGRERLRAKVSPDGGSGCGQGFFR